MSLTVQVFILLYEAYSAMGEIDDARAEESARRLRMQEAR